MIDDNKHIYKNKVFNKSIKYITETFLDKNNLNKILFK